MLLVAFFAQGILAAHACVAPDASAVQTFAMPADVGAMSCHEAEAIISNECLMHCTQSDQVNLDHHTMAAAPAGVVILHIAMPQLQRQALTLAHTPLPLNTGPPLPIRFCSFLI